MSACPALERRVQRAPPPQTILSEMQRSGTVYNLTTQQMRDLRAVGMPASIISQMQSTYRYALQKNPDLARNGRYWTQIDGYWYGGLPFGWSRDWVVGAPSVSKRLAHEILACRTRNPSRGRASDRGG